MPLRALKSLVADWPLLRQVGGDLPFGLHEHEQRAEQRGADNAPRLEAAPRGVLLVRGAYARAHLDSLLNPLIARRRAGDGTRGGMVAELVGARRPDGSVMDDEQVESEALSIFRGHRTAGTALCWMWYLLSRQIRDGVTVADWPGVY